MQPSSPLEFEARIGKLLGWVVLVEGALLILCGLLISSVPVPFSHFRIQSGFIVGIGVIAAFAARWLSTNFSLALAAILTVILGSLALFHGPPKRGDVMPLIFAKGQRVWRSEKAWEDNPGNALDPHVGRVFPPNWTTRAVSEDFDVTYHTDANGWRVLPLPRSTPAKGEIWFLGCSFTFGWGVEDDQPYVYRLAANAWPDIRTRNFSINGWATTNMYLELEQQLAHGSKPDAVVYGWIDAHRIRNYLRKSWHGNARAQGIPKFEVTGGDLRFLGIVPYQEANWEDGPALDEKEYLVTEALVRGMARMCKRRNIPFVMLLLRGADNRIPNAVSNEPGLQVLDVREVNKSKYPHDGHPPPEWHQAIANAVAVPLLAVMAK